MQSQHGPMLDMVWAPGAPSSLATASEEGTVCVWDATVRQAARARVRQAHACFCGCMAA